MNMCHLTENVHTKYSNPAERKLSKYLAFFDCDGQVPLAWSAADRFVSPESYAPPNRCIFHQALYCDRKAIIRSINVHCKRQLPRWKKIYYGMIYVLLIKGDSSVGALALRSMLKISKSFKLGHQVRQA